MPSAGLFLTGPNVDWVGEPEIRGCGRRLERHYSEFNLNDESYRIGDCVLISKQGTISQALGAEDAYIARIMDLFEKDLIYNKNELRKYALVQWYWQWDEVAVRLRKLSKMTSLPDGHVIQDLSNLYEKEIDLETIIGKCEVSTPTHVNPFCDLLFLPKQWFHSSTFMPKSAVFTVFKEIRH
ncbi:origin recognition complex subunit 1-like isoform X1 [Elysia marginata]|uniref:Origin recognition complex subunit 1-like isoform X1 n=1 Tax=Elysia marginata TaxID=1093978 RepID=A0AAV4F4W4_9GAST|nr:origin recognition complex subunit 1-like isoform X1 [Elysia marginata]